MKVNNYDIIVIGTNVSALIAASFLCKNGYRVLIVHEEGDADSMSRLFDEDATTFISGCASNRLLYNIFRELSIPIHHQKKFKVKEISYQLALPECRLDVGSSWNLYYQEVKREFSKDLESLEYIYDEVFKCDKLFNEVFYSYLLHPQKFSSKLKSNFVMYLENVFKINEESRSISEVMLHEVKNPLLKDALELQANMFTSLTKDKTNLVTLFLLGTFQRGIVQETNKLSLLKRILKEQIALTHGEFMQVKDIDSIRTSKRNPLKDKKGIVIRFKDIKNVVESKFLIYGQPLYSLPERLGGMRLSSGIKRLAKRFAPHDARLTFRYKIDRWGIPAGLRSRLLYVPTVNGGDRKRSRPRRELLVSITPVMAEDNANDNGNTYLLKGTVREPFHNGTIKGGRIKALYDEMTSHLTELIPFYSDFVRPDNDMEFKDIKIDELKDGDFIYNASFLRNLSLGEVKNCEVLKNIFFAGKEFLPQLGFEGEVISGWRTANVIISKFKLHKML